MSDQYQDPERQPLNFEWVAPPPSVGLRSRVLNAFDREIGSLPKRRWSAIFASVAGKGLLAGAAVGAAVVCIAVAQAFPQSLNFGSAASRAPYFVESSLVEYAENGSSKVKADVVSYSYKGTEIVMNSSDPNGGFEDTLRNFHYGARMLLLRIAPGLVLPADFGAREARFQSYVRSRCADREGTVVGHETVFGYSTTLVQETYERRRYTLWLAPDLGCFALKVESEELQPGGSYRVVSIRKPVRVSIRSASGGWEPIDPARPAPNPKS